LKQISIRQAKVKQISNNEFDFRDAFSENYGVTGESHRFFKRDVVEAIPGKPIYSLNIYGLLVFNVPGRIWHV
jgi:hypothetical protein